VPKAIAAIMGTEAMEIRGATLPAVAAVAAVDLVAMAGMKATSRLPPARVRATAVPRGAGSIPMAAETVAETSRGDVVLAVPEARIGINSVGPCQPGAIRAGMRRLASPRTYRIPTA
jgi:hypothetical protein